MLPDYALGILPREVAAEVELHLAGRADDATGGGCVSCFHEFAQCQSAAACLAMALPQESPPASVKQALLERVRNNLHNERFTPAADLTRAASRARPEHQPTLRRARWWALLPYAAAGICAALIGVAVVHWVDYRVGARATLARELEERLESARQAFPARRITLASLDSPGLVDSSRVGGYVIWDLVASQLHVFAFDLGSPKEGNEYRFWFASHDGPWITAGRLQATAEGAYSAVLEVPPTTNDIVRCVVTEEPLGAGNVVAPMQETIRLSAEFDEPPAVFR